MKCLTLTISLFVSGPVMAQTYSNVISDEEIINFINLDIKRDSVKGIRTVTREMFKLIKEDFYFKDSADFDYNNDKYVFFIFQRHVFKGREISFHLDTLFNRRDIDYFLKQIEGLKQRNLWEKEFEDSRFFGDANPDSIIRVESNYNKRVKLGYPSYKGYFYSYSIPLFSADKKKAIIIKGYTCGMVCGGGGYYVYTKTDDNRWKLLTVINRWAS